MLRTAIFVALGVVAFVPRMAAADDFPASLVCAFKDGNSWSYENSTFQSKHASPMTFEIDNIDLEGQTAVLKEVGNETTGNLRIVRAINANHFLEVVNEGFLNLTTIYDKDPSTGLLPAVHSRHFGLLGEPIFAQYTGTCRPK